MRNAAFFEFFVELPTAHFGQGMAQNGAATSA
jgi:hypothetical protein